jgi:hypothetical protein
VHCYLRFERREHELAVSWRLDGDDDEIDVLVVGQVPDRGVGCDAKRIASCSG